MLEIEKDMIFRETRQRGCANEIVILQLCALKIIALQPPVPLCQKIHACTQLWNASTLMAPSTLYSPICVLRKLLR